MLFMDGTLMIAASDRSSDGLSRDLDFCSLLLSPSATVALFSPIHPNFLVLFLALFFFFSEFDPDVSVTRPNGRRTVAG